MLWKSESEIREIVRDEIKRMLKDESDCRSKRVYDEEGNLVGTEYTYYADEGHMVHFITKEHGSKTDLYVGHSRSQKNWEQLQREGGNIENSDLKFNEESVYRRSGPIPAGFMFSPAGLVIPERKSAESR